MMAKIMKNIISSGNDTNIFIKILNATNAIHFSSMRNRIIRIGAKIVPHKDVHHNKHKKLLSFYELDFPRKTSNIVNNQKIDQKSM
jgi:hypothetical protein